LLPFSEDPQRADLQVEVAELEGAEFARAQSARVEQFQDGDVAGDESLVALFFDRRRGLDQPCHLVGAHHHRQVVLGLGALELVEDLALRRAAGFAEFEVDADGGEAAGDGLRALLVPRLLLQVAAEIVGVGGVERAAEALEMPDQVGKVAAIGVAGVGREAALRVQVRQEPRQLRRQRLARRPSTRLWRTGGIGQHRQFAPPHAALDEQFQ
jgi:hypothetical protein